MSYYFPRQMRFCLAPSSWPSGRSAALTSLCLGACLASPTDLASLATRLPRLKVRSGLLTLCKFPCHVSLQPSFICYIHDMGRGRLGLTAASKPALPAPAPPNPRPQPPCFSTTPGPPTISIIACNCRPCLCSTGLAWFGLVWAGVYAPRLHPPADPPQALRLESVPLDEYLQPQRYGMPAGGLQRELGAVLREMFTVGESGG